MPRITLTRMAPSTYAFERQGGDLSAVLFKAPDGAWLWSVEVCGDAIGRGEGTYSTARTAMVSTLECVADAFSD